MTVRDVLFAAAALAEHQPTTGTAIRAALSFVDRYPAALSALEVAERHGETASVAIILARHCTRHHDIAESLRHAALTAGATA
jgi:hypothetical protein